MSEENDKQITVENDGVFQRIADVLAQQAEQIGELQGRLVQAERDLTKIDEVLSATLVAVREHASVLRAITQPRGPAPERTLN